MEQTNGKKTMMIVIALIIVIAIAAFVWMRGPQAEVPPAQNAPTAPVTGAVITPTDLESMATSVNTGDLNMEFDAINKDLNSL
ncbi:MAG: hypothetical protein NTZ36_00315 [Candidatus Jorgensenbacteria bacterium]|nr:hypothetical protein [Candidatus Jorgensenbacteria bacterium]